MEKEYSIPDVETDYRTTVTKEQYEAYLRNWEAARPKLDPNLTILILVGTGGDLQVGDNFQQLFYNTPVVQWKDDRLLSDES